MEGRIAYTDWEACYTCEYHGDNGCKLSKIDLKLELGDFILCVQYKNIEEVENDSNRIP